MLVENTLCITDVYKFIEHRLFLSKYNPYSFNFKLKLQSYGRVTARITSEIYK